MDLADNASRGGTESAMAALGRIPSGLFVLTFRQNKEESAMLASWVQQCSFQPPLVSIAIRSDRPVLEWLADGAVIMIHVLGEGQKELLSHFGKGFAPGEPPFTGIAIERSAHKPSLLVDAHAVLEVRVQDQFSAGDHTLVIGKVESGTIMHEGRPGVHVRRSGIHY